MRRALSAVLALFCFLFSGPAFAQTTNATLGGTVSDPTGALIPGVTVKATNTQTGIVTTVLSNEAGAYQFASLQTGIYTVTAELPGFQTQAYNAVNLGVSQQVRLNFTLQVGTVAQSVEVSVTADTLIATTSSSVGTVLPEYKVRDLPLPNRDVFGLVATTAGVLSGTGNGGTFLGVFAGQRVSAVNNTRDGMNVSEGRYDNGAFSATYTSPDLIEEVRVIVSNADAESARGSGQVQMTTRSGTNQFKGSVFWNNRNSALDANNWFNNYNGVGVDYLNRNQYGARLGGPIFKNKTFFFGLFEGERIVQRQSVLAGGSCSGCSGGLVLTAQARQGTFRYFPGVQSGNALSSNPSVDISGNPVQPRGATGGLLSFNLFARDQLRPGYDPSGYIQSVLAKMPLPNDFTVGDGLNTAGYRWTRRISGTDFSTANNEDVNRDQYNFRIDHNFSTNHKLSVIGTKEKDWATVYAPNWPGGYNGLIQRNPDVYTVSFVSTLSPNLVNEFRAGRRRSSQYYWTAMTLNDTNAGKSFSGGGPTTDGKEAFALIPKSNGIPFLPKAQLFPEHFIMTSTATSRGTISPLWQYTDTLSWTHGQHAFKGGVETRFTSSVGGANTDLWPRVFLGAGGVPVTNIDSSIPGLSGADQTNARIMLTDLAGSVASIREGFMVTSARNPQYITYPNVGFKFRNYHQNEWSVFFKDEWKVKRNLTFNWGARYDFYGVPYDSNGLMGRPVGGSAGLWGISGSGFADMYQPGHLAGSLTTVEFVGKNSPKPGTSVHNNDWKNIAPALGFSWSLPWLGKDKTVLRAGYSIAYTGAARLFYGISTPQENLPGTSLYPQPQLSTYLTLAGVNLPITSLVPAVSASPLTPVPLTDRTLTFESFDNHFYIPYIQNFNVELQRELANNLTMEVRYVGSKGTKLFGSIPLNDVNIFENGILDAFNTTRAGGNAPLFDQMLKGLNLGLGTINGTSITGSASLRNNSIFKTAIANNSVGQFANLLNTTTTVTGVAGGLIQNGGLPANFVVPNPQFLQVLMDSNPGNSTYHSLNLAITKRLSHGFTDQTTYTWSKTLGENDTDGTLNYINPRNRSLNKTLLGYSHTHDIRSNGTLELPFGPNRALLSHAPPWLSRVVERWQFGSIFSWISGAPLSITASSATFTQNSGPPSLAGNFPKSSGQVTRVSNGIIYFKGLSQVADPGGASVTPLQGLNSSFSNKAITDSQGGLVLVNPAAGTIGNMGQKWIMGPPSLGLDMDLVKHVRISETKDYEFRLDALNVMNHPVFGAPVLDINNTNFGRITSATGSRTFVVNARVNF